MFSLSNLLKLLEGEHIENSYQQMFAGVFLVLFLNKPNSNLVGF